MIFIVSIIPKR